MRKPGKTALVIIVTFMMLSINTRARSSVAVSDRPIIAWPAPVSTDNGSAVDMHEGISVLRQLTGCSYNEIVRMASMNPAIIARCQHRKGQLKEGYDAELVLLDQNFSVKSTYVKGQRVFG